MRHLTALKSVAEQLFPLLCHQTANSYQFIDAGKNTQVNFFPLNIPFLEINFQTLQNISTDKLVLHSLDTGWWSKLSWIYFSATTAFDMFHLEEGNTHLGSYSLTGRVVSDSLIHRKGDVWSYNLKKWNTSGLLWTWGSCQPPLGAKLQWLHEPKGLSEISMAVPKSELSPVWRRALAPRDTALLWGLSTAPRWQGGALGGSSLCH